MSDLNVVLAGAAGQGVQSAAAILGKTLIRLGYHVFTTQDYQSLVRGGHNFMRIRFSDGPLTAERRRTDFLLALNSQSLDIHLPDLNDNGLALCLTQDAGEVNDPRLRALPLEVGPDSAKGPKFVGVKLLSMLFTFIGFAPDTLSSAIKTQFGKKLKPEVLQANLEAVEAVAAFVDEADIKPLSFKPTPDDKRILVSGNHAIGLGMIAAGVGVYAGYPMSPSTSILTILAEHGPKLGIAVEQVEDEIAAINVAIGGSYAGARAATGSSGGGFSLMVEALGLAGVTETPLVLVDAQRPGPATGMATRTEQSDLLFVIHAAQGEFPRAVIAPADHNDAFYMTAEAFNLADRWQVPVIIMDDQTFADSECTVTEFDLSKVTIDRGPIAEEPPEPAIMKRYQLTDSGVSPRAFPTFSKWMIHVDSHEHDEVGHLTDNPENRNKQTHKRMKKLQGIADAMPAPEVVGDPDGALLLCWGSTVGSVLEALPILRDKGYKLGAAIFRHIYPMNVPKVTEALSGAERLISIEGNYLGQLGKLLRMETGMMTSGHIGKIDGRPFTVEDVVERVEKYLEGQS